MKVINKTKCQIIFRALKLLFPLLLFYGCVHNVAFKQPDIYHYSSNIPLKAALYMDNNLKAKKYSARAFSSGIAHRWDIPVGDVVYSYAVSYLKNGFISFKEMDTSSSKPDYNIW